MVTVLRAHGFSVRIYKDDHPPAHVHVVGNGGEAKINLAGPDGAPLLVRAHGLSRTDLRRAFALVGITAAICWLDGEPSMTDLTDAQIDAALQRGEDERANMPIPASVRFDAPSGRLVVEFTNGAAFLVPARALQGLEDASDEDLADVELVGETGLHWPRLDEDFTIKGLMGGIFGTAKFMEASRRGGQSRSAAKVAASRVNGLKGGRPKKRWIG